MSSGLTIEWALVVSGVLITTMFGLLATVFGWIGNKIYSKLNEMAETMHKIEMDLHGKIAELDRRVTRVETKCDINHGKGGS